MDAVKRLCNLVPYVYCNLPYVLKVDLNHFIFNGYLSLQCSFTFIILRGTKISVKLCFFLRINLSGKCQGVTHKLQSDATRRNSTLPCAFNEGSKSLHKQWVPFLVVHYPICDTEMILKVGRFMRNLRM